VGKLPTLQYREDLRYDTCADGAAAFADGEAEAKL